MSNEQKTKRVTRAHLAQLLHLNGCGPSNAPIANIAFAMMKAGLDEYLALQLARLAHYANEGFVWKFSTEEGNPVWPIHYHMEREHAKRNPNGKCAEDILARAEKRPSRWGTRDFHQPLSEERAAPSSPRDGLSNEARS